MIGSCFMMLISVFVLFDYHLNEEEIAGYYPTVYIRSNCLFLLSYESLNYCPGNDFDID